MSKTPRKTPSGSKCDSRPVWAICDRLGAAAGTALPAPECAAHIAKMSKPSDESKKPKKPKDPARPTRAKAARPALPPIAPALADLLNPAINRGEAGVGSQTGLQPPPDNSRDRRADFSAAHRARKSTPTGFGEVPQSPYRDNAELREASPELARILGIEGDDGDEGTPPAPPSPLRGGVGGGGGRDVATTSTTTPTPHPNPPP